MHPHYHMQEQARTDSTSASNVRRLRWRAHIHAIEHTHTRAHTCTFHSHIQCAVPPVMQPHIPLVEGLDLEEVIGKTDREEGETEDKCQWSCRRRQQDPIPTTPPKSGSHSSPVAFDRFLMRLRPQACQRAAARSHSPFRLYTRKCLQSSKIENQLGCLNPCNKANETLARKYE